MSLAPTLKTFRTIAPAVGLVVVVGWNPNIALNRSAPFTGALQTLGLAPTVLVALGPQASPDPAQLQLQSPALTLRTSVTLTPSLPEGTPDSNDLTPTLLFGTSSVGGSPGQGLLTLQGFVPTVIRDQSFYLEINLPLAIPLYGYAPTVALLAIEEPVRTPLRGELELEGLAPVVLTEAARSPVPLTLTVRGYPPTVFLQNLGWETVALSGEALWIDVPRVG